MITIEGHICNAGPPFPSPLFRSQYVPPRDCGETLRMDVNEKTLTEEKPVVYLYHSRLQC